MKQDVMVSPTINYSLCELGYKYNAGLTAVEVVAAVRN